VYGQSSPADFECLQFLKISRPRQYMITWVYVKPCHPGEHKNHWQVAASFLQGESKTVLCTAGPQSMYMGGDLGGTIFFNPAVKTSAPQDFWSKVDGENNLFHLTWYRLLISTFGHLQSHFCFWVPNLSILSPPQPGFSLCRWAQIEALKPSETARWHNYIEYHIIYIYILQSSIVLTYLNIS